MNSKRDVGDVESLIAIADLIAAADDQNADANLIDALNSRGPIVQAGRVRIKDIMEAASKSIAAYSNTTESNPGPLINGVSERSFQEALMHMLAGINNLANRGR